MTTELNPVTLTQLGNTTVDETSQSGRPDLQGISPEREQRPVEIPGQAKEAEKETKLSEEEVEDVAEFLNDTASHFNVSLTFKVNDDPDRIVVSVVDKETDEVIRQVPSEEVLQLAERLNEMVGVLFNETA